MSSILLLHGALGASDDLAPLAEKLEEQGLNTYRFSFSGHGKTNFNTAFGIEQFAKELESFIQEKALTQPLVFGYSMGGFVTLLLAAKRPELIGKIITLGTKFNWSAESVSKEVKMLDPERMLKKVPAFAKALEAKHGETWKELLQRTAKLMQEINEKEFLDQEVLASIKTPVLLGLADRDHMVSLEETVGTFRSLTSSAMYMLPGSKHPLETVNTALLAHTILDFANVTSK